MKTDVRILLVGDSGVGKTSLILSLVSEEFPEDVPAKAEEITIPADVTPERVPTHIVDYSSREQDEDSLIDEILKCHVVCVVYAIDDHPTLERISTYWMPLIRRILSSEAPESHKPVILVGNKSDCMEATSMETVIPIMNDFAEVETCVECSAKTLKNISEVFYYAQKAVLHPTAPLYLPDEKDLSSRCRAALSRVFRICDIDNDGILSDREIYQFQKRCFNVPLQPQALDDVKQVIRKHIPEGIQRDGITHHGFLFLHTLFIQRGRHETTWTVLRKFGYSDNLQLIDDYVSPPLDVPPHCTTELTHHGYNFLTKLFSKYDEDNDGCLSPTELQNLFATCPMMPWGSDVNNTVATNAMGWITLKGYLAQWTLTTLLDVSRAMEYLAYLGYMYDHDSQLSAIHVTRDKSIDMEKKQTNRSVFQCHVIGSKSCGKSSFLQGFLSRNIKYVATLTPDHLSQYAINTVQVYGQEKYLLLHEIDMTDSNVLDILDMSCDVACFIYDVTNPTSFEYVAGIYEEYFSAGRVPCLFVASKSEQVSTPQDYPLTPAAFCHMYKLPPPQHFSSIDRINHDVYTKLAAMAAYPHMKSMVTPDTALWLKVILGMSVATGVGLLAYKLLAR